MKNILKKFIVLFSLVFVLVFYKDVFAEDTPLVETISVHLEIFAGENHLHDNDISVNACDSDDNIDTPDIITAYCAILQSGLDSDWNWDWAPGAFVNSIEDVVGYISKDKEGQDVYHYWSWSLNGSYASVGLNQYELKSGDTISLEFIDPAVEEPSIEPVVEVQSNSSSSGSYIAPQKSFSIPLAISFLSSQQKNDGRLENSLYTDWAIIGTSKVGDEANSLRVKFLNYFKNENFNSSNFIDYERHAMALMSLGINPYSGTNINYIKKITDSFDGMQIGDKILFNDDIFGLIVLQKAGYKDSDEIIRKTISFVISKQSPDGSWGNLDMTGAGIMALDNFKNVDEVSQAINKAENYLLKSQDNDGGFGNPFSTSWVIQALSLNDSLNIEVNKAIKYIADKQNEDGGLGGDDINTRIWSTSYAIPAILGLSWSNILESFEKEEVKNVPIKIIKMQNKNAIEKNVTSEEELNNNLLSASAYDSSKHNTTSSGASKIVSKIKAPFVWLWNSLGF